MIKQLQLRGISRNPSDRSVADGGSAESLNVHLDQQETAPTMPPVDVSSDIFGSNTPHRVVYIHKMPGIVNYIAVEEATNVFNIYAYGSTISGGMQSIYAATGTTETLKNVSSIGNTLIVYSGSQAHYFVFKDSSYLSLGNRVPIPALEVASLQENNRYAIAKIAEGALELSGDPEVWNAAAGPADDNHTELLETMDNVWDTVSTEIMIAQTEGVFVAPFFIRYALRLYDGSYIHTSTPILCGGAVSDNWLRLYRTNYTSLNPTQQSGYMFLAFKDVFKVYLHGTFIAGNWSDVVKSIDIFASTPIFAPAMNSKFYQMDSSGEVNFESMDDESRTKTIRDEVLSKGQFYKVMTINVDDAGAMGKLSNGDLILENSTGVSGEGLALNEDMPDGYRDGNQYIPEEGTLNFNNHLMLLGATEMLSHGDRFLNGQCDLGSWDSASGLMSFTLRFKVVDSATGKAHYVLANYTTGATTNLYQAYFHKVNDYVVLRYGNDYRATGYMNKCEPFAWICYPDTRCKQVEVYTSGSSTGKIIPMEPHPLLECSFAFIGFGVLLRNPGSAYESVTKPSTFTEDPVIIEPNKLFLSKFENPWLYPPGNIVTFSDNIIGAGFTSVPLSEGQMGEFPIYVFTEGGIRVAIPTGEGTIAATMTHPNVSRHVAIRGTIFSLEQAIIFTTKKGVMMLSGNAVTELSRNTNGAPFNLSGSAAGSIVATSPWSALVAPASDTATFMAFMKAARPAYDHSGARLLFFNPNKTFQYVYMLETQTWHKVSNGVSGVSVLNSYPDCLVTAGVSQVLNYSTILDDAAVYAETPASVSDPVQPIRGIIVTRPFDLGEPDVRKAIRSLRIRGDFNRGDVQYILLGSLDGHAWKHLTSLRGGSYRMFRMVILTNLMPKERITWIDVDYESRFTNRLR